MDALTFISKLLEHLVWPTLIVVLVLILRKQIVELIPLLKKLEYGKFKAEFAQGVDELKEESQQELEATSTKDTSLEMDKEHLISLAAVSPTSAVLSAWKEVEKSAVKLILSHRPDMTFESGAPYKLIQNCLHKGDMIDRKKVKIFNDLRNLRNKVAHAPGYELDQLRVLDYIDIAMDLKSYLKQMLKQRYESGGAAS